MPAPEDTDSAAPFHARAHDDLRTLGPSLLLPLAALRQFRVGEHRQLISLCAVGLGPLAIFSLLGHGMDISGAFWSIALYFSAFWLFCFLLFFRGEGVLRNDVMAACYFGTSLFTLIVYLPLTHFPPMAWAHAFLDGRMLLPISIAGAIVSVGLPEELCKVAVLFLLWRLAVPTTPRTMLFYGLICGLGFGIREGIMYQTQANIVNADGNAALYYLMNILRLTSLPFLHAIWTGTAGYFIGWARAFPRRRSGLLTVAIGLPAVLHGCYDVFSDSVIGLIIAAAGVAILALYLQASEHLSSFLTADAAGNVTINAVTDAVDAGALREDYSKDGGTR